MVSKLCDAAILGSNIRDFEWAAFCALRFKESVEWAAIWDNWLAKLVAMLGVAGTSKRSSYANNGAHRISMLYRYPPFFFCR